MENLTNNFKLNQFNNNQEVITITDFDIQKQPIHLEQSIIYQSNTDSYFVKKQYFFPKVMDDETMFVNNTWKQILFKNYELSDVLLKYNFLLPNKLILGNNTITTYTPWKMNFISLKDLISPDSETLVNIKKVFNNKSQSLMYFQKLAESNNWKTIDDVPFESYKTKLLLFRKYFLSKNTKFKMENFLTISNKLFNLLETLEALDLSHQNINPENIFLEIENNQIKNVYLGEFGDNEKIKISDEIEKHQTQQYNPIANKLSNTIYSAPEKYFIISQYNNIIGSVSSVLHNQNNELKKQTFENIKPLINFLDGGKNISNIYLSGRSIKTIKPKLSKVSKFYNDDVWQHDELLIILKKPVENKVVVDMTKIYKDGDFTIDPTNTKCKIRFPYENNVLNSIRYVYEILVKLINYNNVTFDYYSVGVNLLYYWVGQNIFETTKLKSFRTLQDKYRITYSMYRSFIEDKNGTIFDNQTLKYLPKNLQDKVLKLCQLIPELRRGVDCYDWKSIR